MPCIGVRSALLAGFLVACGLPLAVFVLWPHSEVRESEMAELRERRLLIADTLAASLERYQQDVRLMFRSFAPQIARGQPVEFARDLFTALRFRHVCVAEPATGRVTRGFLSEQAPCPDVIPTDRLEMLRAMVATERTPISPVMIPDDGGPPLFFVATEAEGLLVVGAVGLDRFAELADAVAFGTAGHAAIVDATGRLMAHPLAEWVAEGRRLAELEPVRRAMQGERGEATFLSASHGEEMIAGFSVAPSTGWGVIVVRPVAEIAAKRTAEERASALVFLAGLGLSAVLALLVSGSVARGVGRVSEAARRLADGEEGVRAPRGGRRFVFAEFDALAESFNAMAQRVERARERISAIAQADALTGLLNRGAFIEAAQRALDEAPREDGRTLFFIDMDRLKAVNDGFGHVTGDALLRILAARLRAFVPPGTLIARHGGDEFLALVSCGEPDGCARFGGELLAALSEPIVHDGRPFLISCSIGAAFWPRDARDLPELIMQADRAMYEAKQAGRNKLRLFDAALRDRVAEDEALKRALQAALAAGELGAAFQPIVAARDGRLVGFEALARWSSHGAPVPPERFIRLAEEAGLIGELGRQIRRHAFALVAELRRRGCLAPVAVNVAESELFNVGFVDEFLEALGAAGAPPAGVLVEITESLFEQDGGTVREGLTLLRRAGLSVALDDFGKGYASFRRLQSYPVDRLKIDLSFFGDVVGDPRAQAMVRSLIGLGRNLDLTITVEGVETQAHEDLIAELDVDEMQGFLHHPALTPADALALADRELRERRVQTV